MNKLFLLLVLVLLFFFVSICSAFADLDGFLSELNYQAGADMPKYHSALGEQFNISTLQVDSILKDVGKPADAFMCLQLGLMTGLHFDQVFKIYNANKGKGWGVIAKELGIKPGSPEFHALKQGNFVFFGIDGKKMSTKEGKGKGQGKGKAKGKDKKF